MSFFQPYTFIQFSFLLIMSLFESSLSLKSTKDAQQLHVDERTKLISLIRAWRSKHDKVLATAQRHRDVIDTLRNDVERLKEEKEIVTNNLRTTLEKERVKNKRTVEELTIKAETARNEPEIQARNLREKLNRLQDETQPIINLYKKRDERMQTQIAEMNDVIADLTSQRDHLERKLENLKAENEAESQRVATEREEFRSKYQTNLDEIRKHCAIRLVQMRHQLETTTSDEQKHFTQEFAKQHEGMELQNTQKFEEQRIRLEEEHRRKIEELKEEHSLARHNLGIAHAAELKDLKKKTELANTRLRQKQSESKNLERIVEESTKKLKYIRTELEHDYVGEVIPHYMTATIKTTKDSPVKMKTLLEELSKRMRDLREAKRELEQQDSGRLRIYDATEQERFLKMEVEFVTKVREIEHLKKVIRHKQLEKTYSGKRHHGNGGSSFGKQFNTFLKKSTRPTTSPEKMKQPEVTRNDDTPKKNPKRSKRKVYVMRESGRSQWLLSRQNSTIQFHPTVNARQAWLDHEIKGRY